MRPGASCARVAGGARSGSVEGVLSEAEENTSLRAAWPDNVPETSEKIVSFRIFRLMGRGQKKLFSCDYRRSQKPEKMLPLKTP